MKDEQNPPVTGDQNGQPTPPSGDQPPAPNSPDEVIKLRAILERKERKLAELEAKVAAANAAVPGDPGSVAPKSDTSDIKKLQAELDEIKLGQLNLPSDELKKEVRTYAQIHGISYAEAANSEYIKFRKDEVERKKRNDEAALNKSGGSRSSDDLEKVKPTEFGKLSDEEWEKLKQQKFGVKKRF